MPALLKQPFQAHAFGSIHPSGLQFKTACLPCFVNAVHRKFPSFFHFSPNRTHGSFLTKKSGFYTALLIDMHIRFFVFSGIPVKESGYFRLRFVLTFVMKITSASQYTKTMPQVT